MLAIVKEKDGLDVKNKIVMQPFQQLQIVIVMHYVSIIMTVVMMLVKFVGMTVEREKIFL